MLGRAALLVIMKVHREIEQMNVPVVISNVCVGMGMGAVEGL